MKNIKPILLTALLIASLTLVNAHGCSFDTGFSKYDLSSSISYDSARSVYIINATFKMCKARNVNLPSYVSFCNGNLTQCCANGINETTKECNTNKYSDMNGDSCNIFKTNPITNCRYGIRNDPLNYVKSNLSKIVQIPNDPLCSAQSNKTAWVINEVFETTSLSDSLLTAGYSYSGSCDGHDGGWFSVPIFNNLGSNLNITCKQDSDCGETMCLEADNFCSEGDAWHNYQTFTCENPNTPDSYCEPHNDIQKIAECLFGCSSTGICNYTNIPQDPEKNQTNNETNNTLPQIEICGIRKAGVNTQLGVKFTANPPTVTNDSTETFLVTAQNLDSTSKTITYKKYSCRCSEHSTLACSSYWPAEIFSGDATTSFGKCHFITESITLAAYETKNIELTVSQYQNQICGRFQLDLQLTSINTVSMTKLVSWSLTDLCQNC